MKAVRCVSYRVQLRIPKCYDVWREGLRSVAAMDSSTVPQSGVG